ncbi:AAA family ATPase [Paenibacillus sp. NEAU-GSW1]|nr:AAA family ATPase [Paenibacillus sp. NEAU-GSW1]
MKLDQRIISLLLETERMDSRLSGVASRTDEKEALEPLLVGAQLQRALLQAVRSCRDLETGQSGYFPVIQLTGPAGGGKKLHVKHVSHALGQPLLIIHGQRLPAAGEALREKLRLLVREAIITGAALAFENTDALWAEESQAAESFKAFRAALSEYAAEGKSPVVFWLNREAKRREQLPLPETAAMLDIALPYPAAVERLFVWKQAANGKLADDLQSELADKYKFTPGQIQGTMRQAFRLAAMRGGDVPHTGELAEASRTQVQTRLSELADKLTPVRGWDDLVLPDDSFAQLKEACARFRYGETVYGRWGFGRKLPYGRGLSMLFAGPPGTGKTMAAEVMAKELGIELYRIDLSRIVSKYIGETEKNLREMFAEAENSGSILFFDEADSLFGKRTEVKDSHDRYANMEAAYLLQRIEAFDGVSILATNLQQNMDEAFLRRMQVIVQFPFPDAEGRERIFRGLLPEEAPVDAELDLPFLAERIDVAGGHIKNIVLSAAFLAAGEGRPIGMVQMIRAAQQEFKKMGKIVVREQFEPYA